MFNNFFFFKKIQIKKKKNFILNRYLNLILLILFLILFLIINNLIFNKKKIKKNICEKISSILTSNYNLKIYFNEKINNKFEILNYFAFQTNIFENLIILGPESMNLINFDNNSIELEIYFPNIQFYEGYLLCSNPKNFKNFQLNQLTNSYKYEKIYFNITEFSNNFNWSQSKCYGKKYETRFCEMKRISFYNNHFIFFHPSKLNFPKPFLGLSSRSSPFDDPSTRLLIDPILTNINPINISFDLIHLNLTYIIGRFYNNIMLYHTIFDLLVPSFETFNIIEKNNLNPNRIIYFFDSQFSSYYELINSLSNYPLNILNNIEKHIYFNHVVLGLTKMEINPSSYRTNNDMFYVSFNYTNKTAYLMRDTLLNNLNISTNIDIENPKILLINRKKSRYFLNIDEIEQYMRNTCDFCDIQRIEFEDYSIIDQIKMVSSSTVLIGVHGSALSHQVFLPKSNFSFNSALIEIFPHKYSCRDWFKSASVLSNVHYFSAFSSEKATNSLNLSKNELNSLKACWNNPESCFSFDCNDKLKNQNVYLEIGEFSNSWNEVLNLLNENLKNKL